MNIVQSYLIILFVTSVHVCVYVCVFECTTHMYVQYTSTSPCLNIFCIYYYNKFSIYLYYA